ncbi:response regulator [Synechococcales cyanobacterium C]|uniref:Response regulator n=1 Tax=Petrachloros mirabilis ULC683 TaxID=2781853 RepID=A0A8K1ZY43_9CYAN|nr:response regulator [Petrachloros mirabilis]NCJ07008.1 response regulator [Petrachloros mirabilis ULC683]
MTTVMVVDDSPTMRAVLCDLLRDYGLEVLEAEDGLAAKQLLKEKADSPPSLLITDIVMPNMNGYELCRWVKQEFNMPVIMCTTKGEAFDRHWGMRQGGDAYITKPFNPDEMIATVRKLLKNPS